MKILYHCKNYLFLLIIAAILSTISPTNAYSRQSVLIAIFDGFNNNVYKITVSYMQRKLFDAITVSTKPDIESRNGEIVSADKLFKDINSTNYKAIVLLNSPQNLSDEILRVVKELYISGKVVAAISTAPVILAEAGILNGKRATVWPTEASKLISAGAIYQTSPIVTDGNIITAGAYQAMPAFLTKLMDMLTKEEQEK